MSSKERNAELINENRGMKTMNNARINIIMGDLKKQIKSGKATVTLRSLSDEMFNSQQRLKITIDGFYIGEPCKVEFSLRRKDYRGYYGDEGDAKKERGTLFNLFTDEKVDRMKLTAFKVWTLNSNYKETVLSTIKDLRDYQDYKLNRFKRLMSDNLEDIMYFDSSKDYKEINLNDMDDLDACFTLDANGTTDVLTNVFESSLENGYRSEQSITLYNKFDLEKREILTIDSDVKFAEVQYVSLTEGDNQGWVTNFFKAIKPYLVDQAKAMRDERIKWHQSKRQTLVDTGAIQTVLNQIVDAGRDIDSIQGFNFLKEGSVSDGYADTYKNDFKSVDEVCSAFVKDGLGRAKANSFNLELNLNEYISDDKSVERFFRLCIGGVYGSSYGNSTEKAISNQGYGFSYKGSVTYVPSRSRYWNTGDFRERQCAKLTTVTKKIAETFESFNNDVRVYKNRQAEIIEENKQREIDINKNVDKLWTRYTTFNSLMRKSAFYFVDLKVEEQDMNDVTANYCPTPIVALAISPEFYGCPSGDLDAWTWDNNKEDGDLKLTISLSTTDETVDLELFDNTVHLNDTSKHISYANNVEPKNIENVVCKLLRNRLQIRKAYDALNKSVENKDIVS